MSKVNVGLKSSIGQKVLYKVTLKDSIVKELDLDSNIEWVTLEVIPSGAFSYGNGTATRVTILPASGEPERTTTYDTRYFVGSIDEVAESIINDWYGSNLENYEKIEG